MPKPLPERVQAVEQLLGIETTTQPLIPRIVACEEAIGASDVEAGAKTKLAQRLRFLEEELELA